MGHPFPTFTYGLGDIIARLGQQHGRGGASRTPAWQTRYLATLIADAGFPAPLPAMRGGRLVRAVMLSSRWPIAAVDAWFAGFMPPDGDPADAIAERAAADEMDRAARDLAAGLRGRRLHLVAGGAA